MREGEKVRKMDSERKWIDCHGGFPRVKHGYREIDRGRDGEGEVNCLLGILLLGDENQFATVTQFQHTKIHLYCEI